jgi:putative effector of murein hydrolase
MTELLSISILPVVLTLFAYRFGTFCQSKLKTPLCNPIIVAVLVVLGVLSVSGLELEVYRQGANMLSWLMTPATVCLAISMYEQVQVLKKRAGMILAGVAAGAISSIAMVLVIGLLCKFDSDLILSLLPKSVTTAIGVPLSQLSGGLGAVTTAAIAITGNLAAIIGPALCKLFRLTDPVAQGVAYGTSGHVVGTSKASELGDLPAAAGSLSLVIAGILTAILFPLLTQLAG